MWEVEKITKPNQPTWFKEREFTDLNDSSAMYFLKKGWMKLLRHYRWKTTTKRCSKCGFISKKRSKVYSI